MSKDFKKLEKDPIIECVSEFRFDTHLDDEYCFCNSFSIIKIFCRF